MAWGRSPLPATLMTVERAGVNAHANVRAQERLMNRSMEPHRRRFKEVTPRGESSFGNNLARQRFPSGVYFLQKPDGGTAPTVDSRFAYLSRPGYNGHHVRPSRMY